ncbi:MAG: endonuclease/exonuclease/phosphatase family protein [Bdellovibrionota bacterium]
MKFIIGAIALLVSVSSMATVSGSKTITIMAYNVENLFDTTHDAGTIDWTYLPIATKKASKEAQKYCKSMSEGFYKEECLNLDWSEKAYADHLRNSGRVIKESNPDIVVLEEIESLKVVNELVDRALGGAYKHRALIEGDDSRGIDVGVISKYPIVSSKRHSTFVNGKKLNTRGILEVTINVNGKKITVFGNHWPSQANPAEERVASAEQLLELAQGQKSDLVMAVGDFNTIDTDRPHPFKVLANDFHDAEQEARDLGVKLMPGTHNHKGEWSSLDRIFVFKNAKIQPDWSSFKIVAHQWMLDDAKKVPKRFDAKTGEGFSDHLPVTVQVSLD